LGGWSLVIYDFNLLALTIVTGGKAVAFEQPFGVKFLADLAIINSGSSPKRVGDFQGKN